MTVTSKHPTKRVLTQVRHAMTQRIREVCHPKFDVEAEVTRLCPDYEYETKTKTERRLEALGLLLRVMVYDALPDRWCH